MSKKTPTKGEPDFSSISDSRLKDYVDCIEKMIFAYQECDAEKSSVLREIWKELSDLHTDRTYSSAIKEMQEHKTVQETEKVVVHKIKMAKRIKR